MVAHHVPTSISAVESQRISIIYYARANGELASLTAQKPGESPNYPPYESANVIKKGNVVVATVPQVAAIAYTLNDTPEIRLYYIGGSESRLFLKELAKSGDGGWEDGALNQLNVPVTKDSLISANVENDVGDVKVFFNTEDDDGNTVPAVAWVVLGSDAWSTRRIGQWK